MSDREIDGIEQEAENSRARVSGLLDELRGRVSPGEMVDQMMSYAGDGAGEFVRTLGQQLRNNPLPALLIGAGVAWLMLADRREGRPSQSGKRVRGAVTPVVAAGREAAGRARTLVANAGDRMMSAYESAGDVATSAADSVSGYGRRVAETATSLGHSAAEAAQEARQAVSGYSHRMAGTASALGQSAAETADEARHAVEDIGKRTLNAANQILHEQPLVAAGLGIAIGAALGAALPASETENRLMGSTSDGLKEQARQAAAETYEKARDAADDIYGTVADTVAREASTRDDDGAADILEPITRGHGSRASG